MLIFKCSYCGSEFEEPKIVRDGGGDIGEDAYQCPDCGSFYFSGADKCSVCGCLYDRDSSIYGSPVACDACLEFSVKKAMTAIEESLNESELEAFYDFYDTIGGDFMFSKKTFSKKEG